MERMDIPAVVVVGASIDKVPLRGGEEEEEADGLEQHSLKHTLGEAFDDPTWRERGREGGREGGRLSGGDRRARAARLGRLLIIHYRTWREGGKEGGREGGREGGKEGRKDGWLTSPDAAV